MHPMKLGELIETLRRKDPETEVHFDFVHFRPKGVHSYRGYYEQLAIGYTNDSKDERLTVAGLLKLLEVAHVTTFTGYKGGEYDMHWGTPMWAANYNEAGGTAIVDVAEVGPYIVLKTEMVE